MSSLKSFVTCEVIQGRQAVTALAVCSGQGTTAATYGKCRREYREQITWSPRHGLGGSSLELPYTGRLMQRK